MDFTNKANDAEALLQFQDFGMESSAVPGKTSSREQTHTFTNYPASHVDIDEDSPENESPNANSSKEGGPSMLSFAYYQQYFDVDTQQVKERLMWSFVPRPSKDTLTHYIRPTPDLYGPFWVCVTLVFCIAIMGNIADYLHSGGEGQHWRYDFRKVSISASTIFCYALLLPLILWVIMWWRRKEGDSAPLGFVEIVSLYGYSLAIYIPISVLWTIPFPFLQWTLVFVGAALSGSVLVFSLWPPLSSSQKGLAVALLSAIVALHLLLAAGLQLYFFRYGSSSIAVSGSGVDPRQLLHVEPTSIDKVTELHPLNLVLDYQPPSAQKDTNGTNTILSPSPVGNIKNQTVVESKEKILPSSSKGILKEGSDVKTVKKKVLSNPTNVTKLTKY